jgi:hypothetical protein
MIDWLISWSWPAFGVVIMANLLVRCQRARAAHRGQPCRVGPPNLGSRVEGLDGQVSEVSPPTALKSLTQVVTVTGQQSKYPPAKPGAYMGRVKGQELSANSFFLALPCQTLALTEIDPGLLIGIDPPTPIQ